MAPGTRIMRGTHCLAIDGLIGRGGMATVWRAWLYTASVPGPTPSAAEPELLALKEVRLDGPEAESLREFFFEEAAALKRLSHPNIVAYKDLFHHNGALCLAMEFVPGETLEHLLTRRKAAGRPVEPARAVSQMLQILGALSACHALGVVHRDIKPSNVLLRPDGVVKLTDFGIAKVRAKGVTDETEDAVVAGTGAYMAPEQVQGLPVDGRADLYAAAVVLFATLTGELPFPIEGKSEYEVRWAHLHVAPIPFLSLVPHAPRELGLFFDRAFAKERNDRYPDGIAMGDALLAATGLAPDAQWLALKAAAARAAQSRKGATTALPQTAGKRPATVIDLQAVPEGPLPSTAKGRTAALEQQVLPSTPPGRIKTPPFGSGR